MHSSSDLINKIASDLGVLPQHLLKIAMTAPLRYKTFNIPKKAGGIREVAQPAREVKAIQYWLIENLSNKLPVHESATAYRSGVSIKNNAEIHAHSRYMLKLDFANFFPSIVRSDIELHLEKYCSNEFDPTARRLIAHVCCWVKNRQPPIRLCIGAPTSPLISNSIMFAFDKALSKIATKDEVSYSRYADDITLSSRNRGVLDDYVDVVKGILASTEYPRLQLNNAKTVRASRAGRRVVTGLVITPDGTVSVGRERKRIIRSMYHKSITIGLPDDELEKLEGLLAFVESVEPGFIDRLKKSGRSDKS